MIIKLKNADFSANNIGTLSTWTITRVLGSGATYDGPLYVDKDAAFNAIVTISDGYELGDAGVVVTMGGEAVTSGVTVDGNTITITIASVTGNVVIKVPTINISTGEEDSGNEDDIPSTGSISVTWEQGAINTAKGTNTDGMPARLRTQGCIKVNSSITIYASGNAEFCPVYYNAAGEFVSSPNAYQTTSLTVSSSQYQLVRIMVRDKSDNNATMTSTFGENYIIITGDCVEVPYSTESDEGAVDANGIHDGTTWVVGAVESTTGAAYNNMKNRIRTGYIPLGSVTVSVSNTAEFCPFLYDDSKTFKSTPGVYQTTSQTFTSADGAYLVLMVRNSADTTTNLNTSYGNNISITIN